MKLFSSLYQGTLRGKSDEILVFTNLLAHADQHGVVDKHWKAISEETGLSREEVEGAIKNLEAPDPESRSPEMDGCRITRLDEHRLWGWQIVNYAKYRAIRNEEDRREQNRLAQERWRNKHNKPPSSQAEAEAEAKIKSKSARKRATPLPEPFEVSDRVTAWAKQKGYSLMSLSAYLEFFAGRMKANGKTYTDWDQAFINCIREDWPEFRKAEKGNGAWWASAEGIKAKGHELGLEARPGESQADFKGRINSALESR